MIGLQKGATPPLPVPFPIPDNLTEFVFIQSVTISNNKTCIPTKFIESAIGKNYN